MEQSVAEPREGQTYFSIESAKGSDKMLNIERHENLLKKVTENLAVMDGKPWNCDEIDCQDCDFSKKVEPCEENCEKLQEKLWTFCKK